jgi:hypothetical protein
LHAAGEGQGAARISGVVDPEENLSGGNSNEWGHVKHKFDIFSIIFLQLW